MGLGLLHRYILIAIMMSFSRPSRLIDGSLTNPLQCEAFVMSSLMLVVTSVLSRSDALAATGLATKSNRFNYNVSRLMRVRQ